MGATIDGYSGRLSVEGEGEALDDRILEIVKETEPSLDKVPINSVQMKSRQAQAAAAIAVMLATLNESALEERWV